MIISIDNVTKTYKLPSKGTGIKGIINNLFPAKSLDAISNLDLQINKGEIVGYLGVNGAGKSTTIKMLTGILLPTKGTINVLGKDPYKFRREIAQKIGVVFGQRSQLIWDIPPLDTFKLFSKIYEIPKKEYQDTLDYIIDSLNLKDILHVPVRKLSLGQRMCCEVAASLLHKPEILFLDEPTIGLDILNIERIRNFIKKMNAEYKTTILLTTHDLAEVEKLYHRITIIDRGIKVYDGTLENIKEDYGKMNTIKIEFFDAVDQFHLAFDGAEIAIDQNNHCVLIKYNKNTHKTTDIVNRIMETTQNIKDIAILPAGIDDVIKTVYQIRSDLEGPA